MADDAFSKDGAREPPKSWVPLAERWLMKILPPFLEHRAFEMPLSLTIERLWSVVRRGYIRHRVACDNSRARFFDRQHDRDYGWLVVIPVRGWDQVKYRKGEVVGPDGKSDMVLLCWADIERLLEENKREYERRYGRSPRRSSVLAAAQAIAQPITHITIHPPSAAAAPGPAATAAPADSSVETPVSNSVEPPPLETPAEEAEVKQPTPESTTGKHPGGVPRLPQYAAARAEVERLLEQPGGIKSRKWLRWYLVHKWKPEIPDGADGPSPDTLRRWADELCPPDVPEK
jgi:hypothetical protein